MKISKKTIANKENTLIFLTDKNYDFSKIGLSGQEISYINKSIENKSKLIEINQYDRFVYISIIEGKGEKYQKIEKSRVAGSKIQAKINPNKIEKVEIDCSEGYSENALALAEGLALKNYKFVKYFEDIKEKTPSLKEISIISKDIIENDIIELQNIIEGVYLSRDLANEPFSGLNSVDLAREIIQAGKKSGFSVETLDKKQIQALKMGGILAVNKGSATPPTFNIMEWKPKNAKNKKPIVFVGKGLVFDAGGLSIKPTAGSMDLMKMDMHGAASVIGAMYSIAKTKLPINVITLVPSTDNLVDANSYAPGDVIKMHSGLTVEVLNTDAEGRLILADALSYAKKYKPELVIDAATLTGAAAHAIGDDGIVAMGKTDKKYFDKIKESGKNVYERIVEFPMWEEYGEMIKSDIADMKNIGGKVAGAITAGKFLERYTDYNWIHLDIAGPAILDSNKDYRTKGASGTAVRLLFNFIKEFSN